ncbi:MAG: tetratricopeptide repeat protein [Parvibaculum sp.]
MPRIGKRPHRRGLLATTALVTALALSACATAPGSKPTADAPPQSDASLREVAISSTKSQDYIAAAAYWGSLYDRNAKDTEAAVNYSKALRQIGSIQQALSVMQRADQSKPNNADLLSEYGKILAASGHPDQAYTVLTRAHQLKPDDWTVLSARGVALDQLGRYSEAQKEYEAALKRAPGNPSVLTNLGLSYAIEGNLDKAEVTLRKAVSDPQASASARQNLAVVLGLQGKFDEATRLARADLPLNVADNNIGYLREMLTQPALWKQMEALDNKTPVTKTQ